MVAQHRRAIALVSMVLGVLALIVSCSRVPLLAPTSAVIKLYPGASSVSLNSQTSIVAVVILGGVASPGTGTGTGTGTGVGTPTVGSPGSGNPVQNGTQVTFTTSLGTIQPTQAYTNDGQVQVTFVSGGSSGAATITAYSGGTSAQITLKVGTAAAKTITLAAAPATLPAAGGASQVVANVVDDSGTPIGGVPVTFTTDHGTLTPGTASTDSNGNATTVLSTTATAKVSATAGSVSAANPITVTVNARGLSGFGASPTSTTAGTPVTFTVTPTSGANILNVHVDFGDGAAQDLGPIGSATMVPHVYNAAGSYTATATSRDATGDSGSLTTSVIVGSLPVTLTASPNPATVNTPTTYTVGGTTGAVVDHYVWSWDDGTASYSTTAPQTTHTFSSRGTKTTRVDVIGVGGGTLGSATVAITVQ